MKRRDVLKFPAVALMSPLAIPQIVDLESPRFARLDDAAVARLLCMEGADRVLVKGDKARLAHIAVLVTEDFEIEGSSFR